MGNNRSACGNCSDQRSEVNCNRLGETNNMKTYSIQDRELGNYITAETTKESAMSQIRSLEEDDLSENVSTPNLYETRELSYAVSIKKPWTSSEGSMSLDWCGESFKEHGDPTHFGTREEAAAILSEIKPGEYPGWQFLIEEHSRIDDDYRSEIIEKRDLPFS